MSAAKPSASSAGFFSSRGFSEGASVGTGRSEAVASVATAPGPLPRRRARLHPEEEGERERDEKKQEEGSGLPPRDGDLVMDGRPVVSFLRALREAESRHPAVPPFFMKAEMRSIGSGKMTVEFFSDAISVSVCRYRSWSVAGWRPMISAASESCLEASNSPEA